MTDVMCVSACSLLVAVMVVVGGTPSNRPEVRRDVRQATIHTATCSTDNVPTKDNTQIISIALTRQTEYLASVSFRSPRAQRNASFNKTVAARGWLNTTGTSDVNVGLLQSTSLDLQHDDTECKYRYSIDPGVPPVVKDARVAVLPAKVITWNIDSTPGGASAVIESPMGEDREASFDSAQSPLDSLEFLHPQQPNDPTMFIWRHSPHKGLMTLTVIALSDSPLVTNSDRFDCRVKINSTYRACVNPSTEDRQGDGLQVWHIVLICLACIVVVAVISVVGVVLFVVLRRRRQKDRAAIATDTADNKPNESKEEDEESKMAGPVQASDDVGIRHNANDIANESDLGLLRSNQEDLA
ncbi:uncharacterized protein [Littorina saxatilis]|uniref:Uncharacterized protein n=1 Tax=Littorina saxatilis TaxID=31220 RepID=A0AAN9FZJ8_9CAEN